MALAVAAALGLPHAATAQTQDELKALREQVRQLDRRVTEAEQAAIQASSRPASESAMNPAVSVILNGIYSNLSQDPNGFRINGFVPTLGDVGPGVRGLSLGESELALAANVDHNFRGTLIASISPEDSIGVEEGYIQTLSLSYGFTIKAGRFFSAVGYQNQIHAHAWDFTDAPLANKVFLGNQLNEDGIQLKWVAPASFYWDVGVEAGRGRQFPAAAGAAGPRNKNGVGSGNVFTHVGGARSEVAADVRENVARGSDLRGSNRDNQQLHRPKPSLGVGRNPEVGAELQPDLHQLQAAGRILPPPGERRSHFRCHGSGADGRVHVYAVGLLPAGRVSVRPDVAGRLSI